MDKEIIIKLINCKYRSEDDILGKSFLLKEFPGIKDYLMENKREIRTIKKDLLEEFGIKLNEKVLLVFPKEEFPELYK